MTKLAVLIAKREGYFTQGDQPNRKNNPGDLRHSPHSSHAGEAPEDIGIIDTSEDGWADLERQLELYAARGLTLEQAIYDWAPPSENDSAAYLDFIVRGFGGLVDTKTPLAHVLLINWVGPLPAVR